MLHSKTNVGSCEVPVGENLLEIDPVFLYNIPKKSIKDNVHKASGWNISAPNWRGKLTVIKTGTRTDDDCCQCQFRNTDGILFAVAVITKSDFSSSQAFQKVRDSSRYCTQQIQNIVSGDSAVYGVGFLKSEHISQLIHCLQEYFGIGSQSNETSVDGNGDATIRCTQHAQVKTEVTDGLTEDLNYTDDHDKVQVDMVNRTMGTLTDSKYTEHTQIKVEVDDETGHAQITADVGEETAYEPIIGEIEDKTAHAPINKEANDEPAHATTNVKASNSATQAPINLKVEDETVETLFNVGVKDKTTQEQNYTANARIKVEVDYDTEHVQINMDVERETARIIVEANDEAFHAPVNVEVEDETAHALIKLKVNDKIAHASAKVSLEVKKNASNTSTQEQYRVNNRQSDLNSNGFLYYDSVTKYFTCHLCPFTSNTTSKYQLNFLLIHWASSHSIKKPHICKLCHLVFPSHELRAQHVKTSRHKICSFCSLEFGTEDGLGRHVKDLHLQKDVNNSNNIVPTETEGWTWMAFRNPDTRKLTCPICPEPLSFPPEKRLAFLFHHLAAVHNLSEPPTCRLCSVIFSTADRRLRHIKDLHKECPICDMEFARNKSLRKHLKSVHDLTPTTLTPSVTPVENGKLINFLCLICSREFEKMIDLNNHVKRVHNSNSTLSVEISPKKAKLSYGCSICSKEFENRNNLNDHFKRVHNSNSKTPSVSVEKTTATQITGLSCSICSLKFNTEMHLQFHYKGHLGQPNDGDDDVEVVAIIPNEQDFQENSCKVCKRSFGNEKALEEHLIRAHYERKLGQSVSECVPSAPLVPVTKILPSIPDDLLGIVLE